MPNTYLPIAISLKMRSCLVVGGGKVALRKIDTLLDYGSDITVIAPEPHEKIEYYAGKGLLKLKKRAYKSSEAESFGIVISASNNHKINETVYDDCAKAGVPVNVVDNPRLCDFIFPAVVRRDCLTVAVSTDGKAPFLSGHLRLILENMFNESRWERIAGLASSFRKNVHKRWPDNAEKRGNCFGRFLDTDWQEILKEKDEKELQKLLDDMLEG